MPGNKYASICNPKQYRKLRSLGHSKEQAARISNAQSCKVAGVMLAGKAVDWDAVLEAITLKHPGHGNQKIHGRRTARRRASAEEYQRARQEGASVGDARQRARDAGLARRSERDARLERMRGRPKPAPASAPAPKPAETPKPAPTPEPKAEPKQFRTAQQADTYHKETTGIGPGDLSKAEDAAIRTYQGYDYEAINGALRGDDKSDADINRVVRDLDSAMKRSVLTEDVVTHRGMVAPPGSNAARFLDSLQAGSTFTDKAYTSTTVDPKGVDRFLGNLGPQPRGTRKVYMKVRVPKGSRAVYMNRAVPKRGYTDFTKEYELLMSRGGSYRVVSRSDSGGKTYIEVEYVPGP